MGQSAIYQFLALPELVALIVDFAFDTEQPGAPSDSDSPAAAVLVEPDSSLALIARIWTDPVTNRLWETQSSFQPLCQVSRGRQQYYANKIRALSLEDPLELDTHLPRLSVSFPLLNCIELGTRTTSDIEPTQQYLQTPAPIWTSKLLGPQVHTLSLETSLLSTNPDILLAISNLCPHIEDLTVYLGAGGHPPRQLLSLVQGLAPYLRNFKCMTWAAELAKNMPDFLTTLESLDALESLQLGRPFSLPLFEKWCASRPPGPPASFPRINDLFCTVPQEILPHIAYFLPLSLDTAEVLIAPRTTIWGGSQLGNALPAESRRANRLKSLTIRPSGRGLSLKRDTWLALGQLWYLNTLHVFIDCTTEYDSVNERLDAQELTDDVFINLCRSMPLLQDVRLDIIHSLTTTALVALGTYCQCLDRFQIPGRFDIVELFNRPANPVLFPWLKTFLVSGLNFRHENIALGDDHQIRRDEHKGWHGVLTPLVREAKRHIPRLPEFVLVDDPGTASILNRVFRQERERDQRVLKGIRSGHYDDGSEADEKKRPTVPT